MTQNQIEAIKLINQINVLAEELSSLIKSDSENLLGYTVTVITSFVDDDEMLNGKSIIKGRSLDIANVHSEIMFDNDDYFTTMCFSLTEAIKLK
ncbi:MAG: hypothetical protein C4308_14175, partial [Chitinophagaceae bacterium]